MVLLSDVMCCSVCINFNFLNIYVNRMAGAITVGHWSDA